MNENRMILANDKATRLSILADRAVLLIDELATNFLYLVDNGQPVTEGDTHNAVLMGDMLLEMALEMQTVATTLIELIRSKQEPEKDHQDMTRAERIDEILNDINKSVSRIEERPDWLECMKDLNYHAIMLGMGCSPRMGAAKHVHKSE